MFFLEGEGSLRKINIERGLPKKGDLDSFPIYGGLGKKKRSGVFERAGVDTSMYTMCTLYKVTFFTVKSLH